MQFETKTKQKEIFKDFVDVFRNVKLVYVLNNIMYSDDLFQSSV